MMKWMIFRYRRATGQLPWWWERDRRDNPEWNVRADLMLAKAKGEGMF